MNSRHATRRHSHLARAMLAAVVGLTAMGSGCLLSDTDVPGTAILRCDTAEDCPSSWSCDTAFGRCVAPGGPRFEGTPEVDRTPFGPLSSLTVRFSFDRNVQLQGAQQLSVALADPVLGTPLDGTSFTRIDLDDDDGEFLFSLPGGDAVNANLEEGVFAVTVQATSLEEVPSTLVAALVQWDETPPTVVESALDLAAPIVAIVEEGGIDAFVINTRVVNATVLLSEDASVREAEPTTVVLRAEDGAELAFETVGFGPSDVRVRLTPATTGDGAQVPFPDGLYSLVVTTAHDLAGNALAEEAVVAQVFVDNTAPTFETFVASPTLASTRDSIVTLCAHVSDPRLLDGAPTSDGSPSPLSVGSSFDGGAFVCARDGAVEFVEQCGGATGDAIAFSCTLDTELDSRPDEDGAFVIFGFSQDIAGNVGEASVVVQYDTRAPSIVDGNVRLIGNVQSAVANPFALTSGSALVVLVSADELVRRPFGADDDDATAPPAFLVCPPSASPIDNGDGTFSESAAHFELLPSASVAAPASFYRYDGIVVDAPPPPNVVPPFVAPPDGECAVEFWFQDDAGNVAALRATTATFGSEGDDTEVRILIDRLPPAIENLDTSRLVHIRAPWGFPALFSQELNLDNEADSFHTVADLPQNAGSTVPEVVAALANSPTIERDVFDPGFVDGVLLLRLYSDPGSPFEVGRILPIASNDLEDPIAEWDQPVVFIEDTAEIWVAAVDFAGNESERVRIDDGAWLATLNGKIAGSTLENPHALYSQPLVSRHLSLEGAVEQSHAQPATVPLEVTTLGSGTFARIGLTDTPGIREFAQMALDTARARIVMFGGLTTLGNGFEVLNDQVWERKGENWVQRCLRATTDDCGARPPGRSDHMSTYDAKAGEVLIAGGRVREANDVAGAIVLSPDLWGFDGTNFRRVCGGDAACSLLGRRGGAMASDPLRSQTLIVGGCTSIDCSDLGAGDVDTIIYDGTDVALLGNVGVAPSARHRAALVYNPDADVFVLFGGCADLACTVVLNDTWAFSPSTRTWQELPAATSITGGQNPRLVFLVTDVGEALSGSVLLLGAQTDTVYLLQNGDWVALTTEVGFSPPSMLGGAGGFAGLGFMAVGDLEERVLVFSGQTETGALSPETFLLESRNPGTVTYKRVSTALLRTPRAALRPNLLDDPEANRFVAHVVGNVPGNLFNEVWTFNGHLWNQICDSSTTACGPPAFLAMAARSSVSTTSRLNDGKQVVLFDEVLGRRTFLSTSVLDTPPFAVVPLLPVAPEARPNRSAISRANAAGDVVLFGGEAVTPETAVFRGLAWTIPPANTLNEEPPLLRAPAMAYDEREQIAVLAAHGSAAAQDLVWFFDGVQWTEVDAPNGPGPRVDAAMTYDSSREAFVVWGGCRNPNDCPGDLWELAVTRSPPSAVWREIQSIDPEGDGVPVGRASPGFVTSGAGTVLHGGTLPIIEFPANDTWSWRSATSFRPGQIFQVDFNASGVPPDANLLSVGAAWNIGGSTPTTTGVFTALWDGGRWRTKPEQANNAGVEAPLPVSLVEEESASIDLGRLFFGNRRLLHLLATTKGVNQKGTAALKTEGTPTLFVRYRLR